MAKLAELRAEAKRLGIPTKTIRSAETVAELQSIIKNANGSKSKRTAKKAVTRAVTKKKTTSTKKRTATKKDKQTTKKSAERKRTPAAKSTKGKAKRSATANGDLKRNLLGNVKFSQTDGWNPREGSTPDLIVKALRKAKGDREKAYKALLPSLKSLVPPKTRDGRTRDKSERQDYLRYLISRNAWAFAIATGQHEAAEGRVEYGTGGTGKAPAKTKRNSKKTKTASKSKDKPKKDKKGTKKGTKKTAPKNTKRQAAKRKASRR